MLIHCSIFSGRLKMLSLLITAKLSFALRYQLASYYSYTVNHSAHKHFVKHQHNANSNMVIHIW